MSSNLDRSLDEILSARPGREGPIGRSGRRGNRGVTGAPSGGIRKRSQRVAAQKANASVTPNAIKAAGKTPTGPKINASKIIVSNLPYDVTEQMLKEYFQSVVGAIKKAQLTYGPDGQSRGVATVEFQRSEHAAVAAQKYNGVEVDKRPMKVELVVDPNAPPSFAERIGQPNKIANKTVRADKPKPISNKPTAGRGGRGARGSTRGRGRGGAGSGRGKPKTAEQLDQEMSDYFDHGAAKPVDSNAAPAPATVAANGGDVGMEDTVL